MMPFDSAAYANVSTSSMSSMSVSSGTFALILTTLVLVAALVIGSYVLYSVENFLRAHQFIRNFFKYFYFACKYVFIGAIEVAMIWVLYQALKMLAEMPVAQQVDPYLIGIGAVMLVAFFMLGFMTERIIKRFKKMREAAKVRLEPPPAEMPV